jgi:threonine dehydrogenase-like Zn-dependent dehydrogenase
MKAAIFEDEGKIEVGERPDPVVKEPTDVIVRVVMGCVCGSDLWYYRGINPHKVGSIGHEFIGVVDEVGSDVQGLEKGDLVIAPFKYSDGTCVHCLAGMPTSCLNGGGFGDGESDGGQGEMVRVPFAGSTLVKVPGSDHSEETLASLLALSDVMCTGNHAAVTADVASGDTVAVVGDGAVGLCAVIAAKRRGADRIIVLSRNPARQELAKEFGATDIVEERGDEAIKAVLKLTDEIGVDAVLECVGTNESMATAVGIARPGSTIGAVGHPAHVEVPFAAMFFKNISLRGGIAPARLYIPELMDDVLSGKINPGLIFDFKTDLDDIKEAYDAMDERRAIKSLIRVSAV